MLCRHHKVTYFAHRRTTRRIITLRLKCKLSSIRLVQVQRESASEAQEGTGLHMAASGQLQAEDLPQPEATVQALPIGNAAVLREAALSVEALASGVAALLRQEVTRDISALLSQKVRWTCFLFVTSKLTPFLGAILGIWLI